MKEYMVKICQEIDALLIKKSENTHMYDENNLRNKRRQWFVGSMKPENFIKEYETELIKLVNNDDDEQL